MRNEKQRIELTDTLLSAMVKLSDGNPGAVTALGLMAKAAPTVDPDSAWGAWTPLIGLDEMGVYGSRIWMLYKDVCGQDAPYCLAVLRAVQLGIVPEERVQRAIDGELRSVHADVMAEVKAQLPRFNAAAEPTAAAVAE